MNCRYEKYINDMLYGKLQEDKEQELREHAKGCSECSGKLKEIEDIDSMVKSVITSSSYQDFRHKTMRAVEDKKGFAYIREFFYKSRKYMGAAAAILLIAVSVYSYNFLSYAQKPANTPYTAGSDTQNMPEEYNIRYERESDFIINVNKYDKWAEGYILGIDSDSFLIIGTNINTEYKQLQATRINVPKTQDVYKNLAIGTRVKYVSDGPTFTSYPGLGGIKITAVVPPDFLNAKSLEKDIIKRGLDAIDDISTSKEYLCAINNIEFENGTWILSIVKDYIAAQDDLNYYNIKIQDETQRVEEIVVYD